MLKKFCTMFMILLLAALMPLTAFANFIEVGGYTGTNPSFTFNTDEAVLVYNKDVDDDPDYNEVWTGSALYIPIYIYNLDTDRETAATAKQIKDNNVQVSHTVTNGKAYVDSIEIVDGKKEKIKGLPTGSLVKVQFSSGYTGNSSVGIKLRLVLSVNKVSFQDTRIGFECRLANREEYIYDNSVYGAQVPTRFKVGEWYKGDVTFDMGDGILYSAKVKGGARYTIDFNTDPNEDIVAMYPRTHLQFYNFRGNRDTFESAGRLQLPIDTKLFRDPATKTSRVYAYEIMSNNQLKALGSDVGSYDSKTQVLTLRTQTLGNYVLSNVKLKQTVDPEEDDTFQYGYATDE